MCAHESAAIGGRPNGIPANLLPYIDRVTAGSLPELVVYGDDYPTAPACATTSMSWM